MKSVKLSVSSNMFGCTWARTYHCLPKTTLSMVRNRMELPILDCVVAPVREGTIGSINHAGEVNWIYRT